MGGVIPPLPQYAFMAWCLVKHRDNFTLPYLTHWIGGWVGPRSGLNIVSKRKTPSPFRDLNPDHPIVKPVVSRYTDWGAVALTSISGFIQIISSSGDNNTKMVNNFFALLHIQIETTKYHKARCIVQFHVHLTNPRVLSSGTYSPELLQHLHHGFKSRMRHILYVILPLVRSRDSSVVQHWATGSMIGGRFSAGPGKFTLHHRDQTGSGAHPASYPVGTRGSFSGSKAAGAWIWLTTSI
jgi:hypothetical protein